MVLSSSTPTPIPTPIQTRTPTATPTASPTPTVTFTPTPAPTATTASTFSSSISLSISPAIQTQNPGNNFDIKVVINTGTVLSRGAQVSLSFDPSLLQCNSVEEGDFFKLWAQAHNCSTIVFPAPVIDNNTGRVSDIGIAIMGQSSGGPTGSGTLCVYHMTAKTGISGQSSIKLTHAEMADQTGVTLRGIIANNGEVRVSSTTTVSTSTPTPASTFSGSSTPSPMPTITSIPGSTSVNTSWSAATNKPASTAVSTSTVIPTPPGEAGSGTIITPTATTVPTSTPGTARLSWALVGCIISAAFIAGVGMYFLLIRRKGTSPD